MEGQPPRSSEGESGDSASRVTDNPPEEQNDDAPEVEVIERDSSPRAVLTEMVPEVVLLIGAIYLFVLAGSFGGQQEPGQLGAGFWPRMAAVGLIVALVARIYQTFRARNRPIVKIRSEFPAEEDEDVAFDWLRVFLAMGLAVAYVLGTMFIGYLFATAAFLFAFMWLGGQRRWYVPLIAIGGALGSASIFIGIVFVALPTGVGIFDTLTVAIYELLGLQ
jgi:Tripartite tricarboxylate transporter TctB family